MRVFKLSALGLMGLLLMPIAAEARSGSVATLNAGGGTTTSSFCTRNGRVTIVHSCPGAGVNGSCGWGETLLTGPGGTYRLGYGNALIVPGCYSHGTADMTVFGTATANSTVWYDP